MPRELNWCVCEFVAHPYDNLAPLALLIPYAIERQYHQDRDESPRTPSAVLPHLSSNRPLLHQNGSYRSAPPPHFTRFLSVPLASPL